MSDFIIDPNKLKDDYVDEFQEFHKDLLAGKFNRFLILNHDQFEDAMEHTYRDDYAHESYNNLPKLKKYEYEGLRKLFIDHLNYNKKSRLTAPIKHAGWLAKYAYNVKDEDVDGLTNENYFELQNKAKQFRRYDWTHSPSWWKNIYWRGKKILTRAKQEIPEMVKETIIPGYVGNYTHGTYGLVEAPKLPGDKVIKTIGKYAGAASSVLDLGRSAVHGYRMGYNALSSVKYAVKKVAKRYLKERPKTWALDRANIREAERNGEDPDNIKIRRVLIDKAASILSNGKDPVTNLAYGMQGTVVNKSPFVDAYKEDGRLNRKIQTNKKSFIGFGGASYRRYKRYHGKYRIRTNRYNRPSYWRRRRPFNKSYKYNKQIKKYRRRYRKYFSKYK